MMKIRRMYQVFFYFTIEVELKFDIQSICICFQINRHKCCEFGLTIASSLSWLIMNSTCFVFKTFPSIREKINDRLVYTNVYAEK